MKRRSFIQTILGITGITVMPGSVAVAKPETRNILLQECELAGFQYYEGERLYPELRVGDDVTLKRAPQNKYDKRAVEVRWKGQMLGHIPRIANTTISQMLDRNEPISTHISTLTTAYDPWKRIKLEIYWGETANPRQTSIR